MKEIEVFSQKELDALPDDFDGRIVIKFGTLDNRAIVNRRFKYAIEAHDNSCVEVYNDGSVAAYNYSFVSAYDNSFVVAYDNGSVTAWGNVQVEDKTRTHTIEISGNARIVHEPKNATEFLDYYGLEHDNTNAKLYKAVHKNTGRYFSDNDSEFEYVIGEFKEASNLNT